MTSLLDGNEATVESILKAFEAHNVAPSWRSSMASFSTMPELTNWVTQGLTKLGIDGASHAKISFITGSDPTGRPYYAALIFWLG